MVKKCCVFGCTSNYASTKKRSSKNISVYRFPKLEDKQRWVKAIPNASLRVTAETVVCELHWPKGFETVSVNGKIRPKNPPSVWPNVPPSQIPTSLAPPRPTRRSSSEARNPDVDQVSAFHDMDNIDFLSLKDILINQKRKFDTTFSSFLIEDTLYVQSNNYTNGVPNFMLRIYDNLNFETFHHGFKCFHPALTKNRVTQITGWSIFEEIIRYLNQMTLNNRQTVIQQQIDSMTPQTVGKSIYSQEMIVRAFQYFAMSRTLYNRLRIDYQLPSVKTLTRITSKVSKSNEKQFLQGIFSSLPENQRLCVLLHDEIYVKKMLLYHGGSLFGKAVNDPSVLASTVLGFMVCCLFGGPKFITKMLPLSKLNSDFLRQQVDTTVESISESSGNSVAILCDANRTNQAFFKSFDTVPGKPWLTIDGRYLLFDFVHLLKNIRNNWLTEKSGELIFYDGDTQKVAKWSHLCELFKAESGSLLKLSKLNETAVFPKPVERQNVSTCLKVFSEETVNALLNHSQTKNEPGCEETAQFINKVLTWWKIVNCHVTGANIRLNDDLRGEIRDPSDKRLQTILQFGDLALRMCGKQGKRVKQFTRDTGRCIHHTCYGLVELCQTLLQRSHEYVLLGQFSTDPLEKQFGKLRQGSGGTYFISVQQIIEKVNISRASLVLSYNVNVDHNEVAGHACSNCSYELDETGSETFDNLPQLELSVSEENVMALVYISGYVTRNDSELSEIDLLDSTTIYNEKYGQYLRSADRGGLNVPLDNAVQWAIFSFIMFNIVKVKTYQKSLTNLFVLVSNYYEFGMKEHHGRILANIFFNNLCKSITPKSGKEPALKVLKLS